MTDVSTAGTGPTHPGPTHPGPSGPATPPRPRPTRLSFDKGSRTPQGGRGGSGGDHWGPGGKYNPDGWGCAAIAVAPVLALLALVALAVTA